MRSARRGELNDSGVGRVLILAIAPKCAETYENVDEIMTTLCLEKLRSAFPEARIAYAVDLKMALILLSMEGTGSRFACPCCLWSRWKKHSCPHTTRSVMGLTAEAATLKKRMSEGSGRSARTGEPPMSCLNIADDIISALPPGTLHIMLGIVPTLVDEVERVDAEKCATWLRKLGVVRNDAQAGADFVGPQCKKILD